MTTILHVFGRMNRGGAELRTLELMPALDPRFRLAFCSLSGLAGDLDARVRELGGTVHPCRLDAAFPLRFRALLRELRPAVVHSHVHLTSGYVLAWAAAAGVRGRVAHLRSMGDGRPDTAARVARRRVLRALTTRFATRVLAVSEGALDASFGAAWRGDPRFRVLYAGLDPARFTTPVDRDAVRARLGARPGEPVWVHVGSMQAAKNHARLARLFAAFARRRPAARLWLVGRPDRAIAAGLAGERVALLGERDDVPALLAAADLMVFPSVREGLPGAVLEARAAGLPVVASDLPGVEEIARRVSGVCCLSLDAPDEDWLAAAEGALAAPRTAPGEALAGTPFEVAASARAHEAVWAEEASR
ncbi:MAG: glycosyltransferase [Myxococcota bacterium]